MTISTLLPLYTDLFVGRRDDYALQLANGRYRRVGKPFTWLDLADHLLDVRTYGTYVIDETGSCRFAVIDADGEDGLQRLWRIQQQLAERGIVSYIEVSRRGGHLWIFFVCPVAAAHVRAWLLRFCPADMEFYPKQDESKGYGSLIRLPMGIHRLSGKRYPFVMSSEAGMVPLAATLDDIENWLPSVQRVYVPQHDPQEAKSVTSEQVSRKGEAHATPQTSFSLSNTTHPTIRQWNAAQDPFSVIGRYIQLNSAGVGQCPFPWHHSNGDKHASFKVYSPGVPGGYCWFCYAWQQGGSVFDFLRYYFNLDARTLWQRIQQGEML